MSDSIETRITAALVSCGLDKDGYTPADLSDISEAVVAALGLEPVYAPVVVDDDDHTWPHFNEWYDDPRQGEKAVHDDPGTVLGRAWVSGWERTE